MLCDVGDRRTSTDRARRRERQRREQRRVEGATQGHAQPPPAQFDSRERRAAATTCGWCGGPIAPGSRGPIPKWCSPTCRHRAWEQSRAAAGGRAAVEIVERHVQVSVPISPGRRDWPRLLRELGHQLDDGRVYDRDLAGLAVVLQAVLDAYHRRTETLARSNG
jgi:hypothetical protein